MENINLAQALANLSPEERKRVLAEAGIATTGGKPSIKVTPLKDDGSGRNVQFRGIPGSSIKFGLTLHAETLVWLFDNRAEVCEFLRKNADLISFRGERGNAVKVRLTSGAV